MADIIISAELLEDCNFPLIERLKGMSFPIADMTYAYNGDEGISELVHEACQDVYPFSREEDEDEEE